MEDWVSPDCIIAGRPFMVILADMQKDPYERARQLFNLGIRGDYSKKAIAASLKNPAP